MGRKEMTLCVLAAASGNAYTPVQVQKALFLIDSKAPELFSGDRYNFQPYDYGPFDKSVYQDVRQLAVEGLATASETNVGWMNRYWATEDGVKKGRELMESLPLKGRGFIEEISTYVRRLSFSQLVSAIYNEFPEMRARSVFKE